MRRRTILLGAMLLLFAASTVLAAEAPPWEYSEYKYPEAKTFPQDERVGWFHTYVNLWWLLPMVGVATLMLWVTKWIDEDARKHAIDPVKWNLANMSLCLAALVAFVAAPPWASLPAALAVTVLVLSRYVPVRNAKSQPTRRIFTPEHRELIRRRMLGLVGIKPRGVQEKLAAVAKKFLPVALFGHDGKVASPAEAPPDERDPASAVKVIVAQVIERNAREVYLIPKPGQTAVSLKVDGMVYAGRPFERLHGSVAMTLIKNLADMNVECPDFSVAVPTMQRRYRVGVQVYGEGDAEEMVLRFVGEDEPVRRLGGLGLSEQELGALRGALDSGKGLIVTASPPEMGARTTVAAMLDSLDPFSRNITTFERRHVAELASIEQNDLNKLDKPLAEVLKQKLLQDYDLMALDEVPDCATVLLAITAAQRDQLFIARLEVPDAVSVPARLIELGAAPEAVAQGLRAVLSQRLVRVLCTKCRMKVTPSAELLQRLHLDPTRVTHLWEETGGCDDCGHTGFNGRTGIFEVWRLGDESRSLIAGGADAGALHAAARHDAATSLQVAGLRRVLDGTTSLHEVARVLKIGT